MENKATREECKPIIREYVYLPDRLQELQGTKLSFSGEQQPTHLFNSRYNDLWRLLATISSRSVSSNLRQLEQLAQQHGRSDVVKLIRDVKQGYSSLTPEVNSSLALAMGVNNTPSRQDNPYRKVSNQRQLKQRLAKVEQAMQEIVIDRRNTETATNIVAAMRATGETTGVVQFGAGHIAGLVQELNRQRISVIVVTPNKVANHTLK